MTTISLTTNASDYIKRKIDQENGTGFRLTVKKTGCSGYSYSPAIVTEAKAGDEALEVAGVSVFIDPMWAHVFEGLIIDYLEEEKSGLKQKRLTFTNPNEGNRCGCGESFHIE